MKYEKEIKILREHLLELVKQGKKEESFALLTLIIQCEKIGG